jgi:hypothetical protein
MRAVDSARTEGGTYAFDIRTIRSFEGRGDGCRKRERRGPIEGRSDFAKENQKIYLPLARGEPQKKVALTPEKRSKIRRYQRLTAVCGAAALVATFGSLLWFITIFPPLIAYLGSTLIGLPFLFLTWRYNSRYSDLIFRDDME